MGRKTPRTKNSAKPSSSGRSAELLTSATKGAGSSIFFNDEKSAIGFQTIDDPTKTIDNFGNIDLEYQLLFRKMTKKDPITKTKALQELDLLIKKSDIDSVCTILPFWPKIYCSLAVDNELRIRECTQQVHSSISAKCGKHIAPILRQIAPVWLITQFDTYSPAASISFASFSKAFSTDDKIKQVLIFCQKEICNYLLENLTIHTPTTMSNAKLNSPEECEAKYQLIVKCCLQTFAKYLNIISNNKTDDSLNYYPLLIDNAKFWSFYKHKSIIIKAAWFEVIAAILQHAANLMETHEQQLAKSLLHNINESNPIVIPHLWASLLLFTHNINCWHTFINVEKELLPKLYKILSAGGNGNAIAIFSHILPLLEKINETILGTEMVKQFYERLFDSINIGLQSICCINSGVTDIGSIATSYYECLQYVVIQITTRNCCNDDEKNMDEEFCIKLVQNHLINVCKWCIDNYVNAYKKVFLQIIALLRYWQQKQNDTPVYHDLLEYFWKQFFIMLDESLSNEDNISEKQLQAHYCLVQILNNQCTASNTRRLSSTKQTKVKFDTESTSNVDVAIHNLSLKSLPTTQTQTDAVNTPKDEHKFETNELVYRLCKLYMNRIANENDPTYIVHVENLLNSFNSAELFQKLSTNNSIIQFTEKIMVWLLIAQLRKENVVDIILLTYQHLSVNDRTSLLKKLLKFPHEEVRVWILKRLLSNPFCKEQFVVEMLCDNVMVKNVLLKSAENVVDGKMVQENLQLLNKCFYQTDNGSILIARETCESIVNILAKSLQPTMIDCTIVADASARFLCEIMPVICSDGMRKELKTFMFLKFFELSFYENISQNLTDDTLWEITTSWQDCLSTGDITMDPDLWEKCSTIIIKQLFDNKLKLDDLEKLSENTSKLIQSSMDGLKNHKSDDEKLKQMDFGLQRIFNSIKLDGQIDWIEDMCLFLESINGVSSIVPKVFKNTILRINDIDIIHDTYGRVMSLAMFKFNVLTKLINSNTSNNDDEDDNDDNGSDLNKNEQHFLWNERILDNVVQSMCISCMGNCLQEHYNNIPSSIDDCINMLTVQIENFLQKLPNTYAQEIKLKLFQRSQQNDYFSTFACLYLTNLQQYNDKETGLILLYEDLMMPVNETIIPDIHIIQIIARKISKRMLPMPTDLFRQNTSENLLTKIVTIKCLIENYFNSNYNAIEDEKIIEWTKQILNELYEKSKIDKMLMIYNTNVTNFSMEQIRFVVETANFLSIVIQTFSSELETIHWDFIRIAASSWILTLSKSWDEFIYDKNAIFMSSIYKLIHNLNKFIIVEKAKSSTEILTKMIDEWDNLFAKDVNLILLKCFMNFIQMQGSKENKMKFFIESIAKTIDSIDYKYVIMTNKIDSKISINDLLEFSVDNLSHNCHAIRLACVIIIRKLSIDFIGKDVKMMQTKNDAYGEQQQQHKDDEITSQSWHLLHKFESTLKRYDSQLKQHLANFKAFDLESSSEIPTNLSTSYLLLCSCILDICSKASPEIRSIYASFLSNGKYEQTMLTTFFYLMPNEILRNPDSKHIAPIFFSSLNWDDLSEPQISPERFACFLYVQSLKHLPAIVRKWWHDLITRQKTIVDKITTNCVSQQLCQNELRSLMDNREHYDNMQLTVHLSSREVLATYTIDEAHLELIITLPSNHPLGAVKVDCGKQIGGRLQSRVLVMQLALFLTHQNGSIQDVLLLWKRNLDRKFEGVEECYICYSVLHQDTCQLPKLTCKTCKKKFHGTCLYKWFSTSNKSTCPICRNPF